MRDLFFDRVFRSPDTSEKYRLALQNSELFLIDNIMPALPEKLIPGDVPLTPPYVATWFEWSDVVANSVASKLGAVVIRMPSDFDGWDVFVYPALGYKNSRDVEELPLGFCLRIGPDGCRPDRDQGLPLSLVDALSGRSVVGIAPDEEIESLQNGILLPIMFSLGLLHCKNVSTAEKGGPSAQRGGHSSRSQVRRHHVLQVRPMGGGKQMQSIGQPSTESAAMSLHFVRGHFKTYTDEAPLFGRLTGSYWWESHARGDANVGIVTKDYSVNPPIGNGETP